MAIPLNPSTLTAILGPTNTGKTHYAVERMLARSSGVIGLPLRLLAREIYDRIVAIKGAAQCALVTGEEKILPPKARYFVCTVEAMPTERDFAFLAIDEVQLMANHERGHIFTDRVLHARGREETLLLGAETIRPVLAALLPKIRFDHRERFSQLHFAGEAKLTRLPKRSVIVAFSAAEVYALAEQLRRYRGGAAVVMGGLSPRTRNAQAELFQSGEVDFLVATDAVGMGLNLDTDHVAFAALGKFDGRRRRALTPMEAAQIAGRAGRFRNDGTFGTTGDCPPMDAELVARIENHNFEPIQYVEWRNSALDFSSLKALDASLHIPRGHKRLRRIKGTTDEAAFERLSAIDEVVEAIGRPEDVRQLWETCQVPDFRNLTIDAHVRLLQDIYRLLLTHNGKLPDDFMKSRISRLDDVSGGVDILSTRLANIRTWTYCAGRPQWMSTPKKWTNIAREVEDRLSDALHEALIARFVDRRTRKLLKGIGANAFMDAKIKDTGEVLLDDQIIGQLDGLKFTVAQSGSELEAKALQAATEKVVIPEINRRLTSLSSGTHNIFTLSDEGQILWGGKAVGKISSGSTPINPDADIIGADDANENLKALASNRMRDFLRAEAALHLAQLQELKSIQERETTSPKSRGFAFTLYENNGAVKRSDHWKTIKELDQSARRQLREANVQFGQYDIYIRDMMKPKAAKFLSLMTAFGAGGNKKPFIPFAGVTSIANSGELASENFSAQALSVAGYHAVGPRIVRFDILNRLSLQIRQAHEQNQAANGGRGFQIMQEMLAIMGCTYEELRGVLTALGFKSETREAVISETPAVTEAPKEETAAEAAAAPETSEKAETAETPAAPLAPKPTPKKAPKTLTLYQNRETKDDGTTQEIPNTEFWHMPPRAKSGGAHKRKGTGQPQRGRKGAHNKGKGKGAPKKGERYSAKPARQSRPEDSPFAALAALKNPDKS